MGCLVLGVGAYGVRAFMGGGEVGEIGFTSDLRPIHPAVTDEPEQRWTWDYDEEDGFDAIGVGEDVLVSEWGEGVTRLDSTGDEVWHSNDLEYDALLRQSRDDDLFITLEYEGPGASVARLSDGTQLWHTDEAFHDEVGDKIILSSYEDGSDGQRAAYSIVDRKSGDERWSTVAESIGTSASQIFVVDGETLEMRDVSDGDIVWSHRFDRPDDQWVSIQPSETMVALDVGQEIIALDTEDGSELWTSDVSGSEDGIDAQLFWDDTFVVERSIYDYEYEETEYHHAVYGRDGKLQDFSAGNDPPVYFEAFHADGASYALQDDGSLYDAESIDLLARYDGYLTVTETGLYAVNDSGLRYFEFGESASEWTMDAISEGSQVIPAEHAFAVSDSSGTLTYYK